MRQNQEIHTQVAIKHIQKIKSPIDFLTLV